ncbi:unnamed protein product, partial [Brachionus calyciflorus]
MILFIMKEYLLIFLFPKIIILFILNIGNAIGYYGSKIDELNQLNISYTKSSLIGNFILPNTEFKFDSDLNGFELYAAESGLIIISLISFNFEIQNDTTAYLLINSPNVPSYNETHKFSYILSQGYNKISLDYSINIKKGQMVMIWTNMPNLLAVDITNDLLYSDYYLNNSKLYKLHVVNNWRFYLNCLIDQKYYLSYMDFSKVFDLDWNLEVKEYFINVRFNQSTESINRSFYLSNLKYGEFECFNSNETIENRLKCSAVLIFQKQNQKILLNKGDCNSLDLTTSGTFYDGYGSNKLVNYSFLELPNTTLSRHFLLSDTIIKFDASLIGFEFVALNSGPMLINLWSISNCNKQACASFLSESLNFNASKINSWM